MSDVDQSDAGRPTPRVLLVETHPALPALLPFQAWDALSRATTVYVRDRSSHPSATHLYFAGIDLVDLAPATLERADLDLTRPGSPEDRRLAKALLLRAVEEGTVAYVLGPQDDTLGRVVGVDSVRHGAEVEFVFLVPSPNGAEVVRLAEVMRRLRHPEDGCPWDLEQDHASLAPHLVEEAYELLDAIADGDDAAIVEELGDVLLQVVFHAQVATDRRAFGLDEVARGIVDKLVRRHPHVFGDAEADTADEVQASWDRIKDDEKQREGPFDGIPRHLPALRRAQKALGRAARTGFDWPHAEDALAKVREEVDEVAVALAATPAEDAAPDADGVPGDADRRASEVGDLLLATVALARAHGIDAEDALRAADDRFRARYGRVAAELAADGRSVGDATIDELLAALDRAKAALAAEGAPPGDATAGSDE